jgi:hypothetical protein
VKVVCPSQDFAGVKLNFRVPVTLPPARKPAGDHAVSSPGRTPNRQPLSGFSTSVAAASEAADYRLRAPNCFADIAHNPFDAFKVLTRLESASETALMFHPPCASKSTPLGRAKLGNGRSRQFTEFGPDNFGSHQQLF